MLELKLLGLNCVAPVVWTYRIASSDVRRVLLLGRIVHFQLRWILRVWPTILIMLNTMLRLLRQVLKLVPRIPHMQMIVSMMVLLLFTDCNRDLSVSLRWLCRRSVLWGLDRILWRMLWLIWSLRFLSRRDLSISWRSSHPNAVGLFIFVCSGTALFLALACILWIGRRLAAGRLSCLLTKGAEWVLIFLISFFLLLRYLWYIRQYLPILFLASRLLKR